MILVRLFISMPTALINGFFFGNNHGLIGFGDIIIGNQVQQTGGHG